MNYSNHCLKYASSLEEEVNASPILSDFFESVLLIGGNVGSLFCSRGLEQLTTKCLKVENSVDIFKKKIIFYSKSLDGSKVLDFVYSLSKKEFQKIGSNFFVITAKKFSKNQSIESYAKLLYKLIENFGPQPIFLRTFLGHKRDSSEISDLLNYLSSFGYKNDKSDLLTECLVFYLEKLATFSYFDDFLELLKE